MQLIELLSELINGLRGKLTYHEWLELMQVLEVLKWLELPGVDVVDDEVLQPREQEGDQLRYAGALLWELADTEF